MDYGDLARGGKTDGAGPGEPPRSSEVLGTGLSKVAQVGGEVPPLEPPAFSSWEAASAAVKEWAGTDRLLWGSGGPVYEPCVVATTLDALSGEGMGYYAVRRDAQDRPITSKIFRVDLQARPEGLDLPRWKQEFPEATAMPDVPVGFDDISWHNDVNPSYGVVVGGEPFIIIAIDEPDGSRMNAALGATGPGDVVGRFLVLDGRSSKELLQTGVWEEAVQGAVRGALEALAGEFDRAEAFWFPTDHPEVPQAELPASEEIANTRGLDALKALARLLPGKVDPEDFQPTFGDLAVLARQEAERLGAALER